MVHSHNHCPLRQYSCVAIEREARLKIDQAAWRSVDIDSRSRCRFYDKLTRFSTLLRRVIGGTLMRLSVLCLLASAILPSGAQAQAPVFVILPQHSWIKFDVNASVDIVGTFDKWNATLTFASPDETTGILGIKIQAASVDTGSGVKDRKLKGKDFFYVEKNPLITFVSNKIVPTGPDTYEVDGDFTIRGESNPEKLMLSVSGKGTGSGEIKGTMVFNRKDYGMNKGIPFIKIADRVDVSFDLKAKRVSGPQLVTKQQSAN